jgi:YHS domain-containing protein
MQMYQPHGTAIDPVCGMTVEIERAKADGRSAEHDGKTYYFCGQGCLLDFQDDPKKYLEAGYKASM